MFVTVGAVAERDLDLVAVAPRLGRGERLGHRDSSLFGDPGEAVAEPFDSLSGPAVAIRSPPRLSAISSDQPWAPPDPYEMIPALRSWRG